MTYFLYRLEEMQNKEPRFRKLSARDRVANFKTRPFES